MTASTPRSDAVAVAHHRDAAPAVGHDHEAGVDERLHGGRVDDLQRLRRGDHAPPALLAPVLPGLAVLDQQLRLLGREEPADGLGRLREPRVVAVDERAGHHRRGPAQHAPAQQRRVQRVHQHEAERRLGLRAAPVQRDRRYDGGGELVLDQQVADLRAVAVGDHDLDVVGQQVRDRLHRDLRGGDLVLDAGPPVGVRHRVPAQCQQHPHRTEPSESALWSPASRAGTIGRAVVYTDGRERDTEPGQRPGRRRPAGPGTRR